MSTIAATAVETCCTRDASVEICSSRQIPNRPDSGVDGSDSGALDAGGASPIARAGAAEHAIGGRPRARSDPRVGATQEKIGESTLLKEDERPRNPEVEALRLKTRESVLKELRSKNGKSDVA